jgi:hypothetical protein
VDQVAVLRCLFVIPALGRWRQEDLKFKVTQQDPISEKKKAYEILWWNRG